MKRRTFLLIIIMTLSLGMAAQPRALNIRYVSQNGKYGHDGLSWATAKNNVQDAINDLVDKGLQGEVWVAQGTYSPTESTEKTGGSTLYMAFKVPAGIVLRGGFHGPGTVPSGATLTTGKVLNADGTVNTAGTSYTSGSYPGESTLDDRVQATAQQTIHGETITRDWTYKYPSILTGDLSAPANFKWNTTKRWWDASFYGNCYHVVWFALNGFDENGRAKPLDTSKGDAHVEGFTIMNGNAKNTEINGRFHNAYGGGVYMVEGSRIENCRITNCEASRDGGGVYMDGGGVVKHCYIFNNQALGIGVQNGYGGGICLDANKSENLFGIYRSVIFGNVGRLGGGLAIKVLEENNGRATDIRYTPFASAVLVGNNTATTEGGGVYTNGGGCITNLTIVRNQCNGSGVINNGVATGRSGGLYCRDHAVVMNSVMWGNECAANNNMQYAASQSSTDEDLRVQMMYCTLSYSDNTDWTGTSKSHVFSLSEYNNADAMPSGRVPNDNEHFANFLNPSSQAGYCEELHLDDKQVIFWRPGANSALANNGIISLNLNPDGKYPFTAIPSDVLGNVYNPRSTIGGYTRQFGLMTPRTATENGETVYHFYVDPNAPTYRTSIYHGRSWDEPARFLANVLYTIDTTPEYINAKCVVHVKEGEVDNTCSYVGGKNVRDMTIGVRSNHITILGGYPEELIGIEEEQTNNGLTFRRDPMSHPTFIVGEITDDYKMNVAHLISFDGCNDVTFDGFQVRYANASDRLFNVSGHDGGGIRFINGATNVRVRNVVIAGCTADRGAAIFAQTGTTASFENVIIHNNEAVNREGAIIYSEGSAQLSFTHCNIMNNVGYPVYLNGNTTQQSYDNSFFFGNLSENADNVYGTDATSVAAIEAKALPSFLGNTAGVTVTNSLFDNLTPALTGAAVVRGTTHGRLTYELNATGYPRFINATHNAGVSPSGDITFYGRATSFMPHNNNPMVNTAKHADMSTPNSWGKDITDYFPRTYGGLPDIGAIENHAATEEEEEEENAYAGGQQPIGSTIYVREGGNDTNSGFSWDSPLATPQVAIEMAYQYNKTNPNNPVKVWIAEGTYTFSSSQEDEENLFGQNTDRNTYTYLNALYRAKGWNNDDRLWNNNMKIKEQYFSICMREGVNVYGGFPEIGYPGENEREPKVYETIIAPTATAGSVNAANKAASVGRAMVQAADFTKKTYLDGVTLTKGYLNHCFQENISGEISQIYGTNYEENSVAVGNAGGCGAFVQANCIVENCNISENYSFFQPHLRTDNVYNNPGESGGGFHQSAAGVYLNGGEVRGCNITNNVMEHGLARSATNGGGVVESAWMYGIGLYMHNGTVYNTIISGNRASIVDGSGTNNNGYGVAKETESTYHQVIVGAGALIVNGNFFNNTVVENTATTYNAQNRNIALPGIYVNTSATIYNCIIARNSSTQETTITPSTKRGGEYPICYMNNSYDAQSDGITAKFCYVDVAESSTYNLTRTNGYAEINGVSTYTNKHLDDDLNLQETAIINGNTYKYTLGRGSACINAGTLNVTNSSGQNIYIPDVTSYDASYTERVKDCSIDIGAFEFDDSYAIRPEFANASGVVEDTSAPAVFYVTPNGSGLASGDSPANAACAAKLQRVLDAAGRYKAQHPTQQVIVKVANSQELVDAGTHFTYYATRTTETENSDVRVWSIIVPRGVEVWGGYSDSYTSATDNGFYSERNITGNPTYFDSYYTNPEHENKISTYHVVTFTDLVFDGEGVPYKEGDDLTQNSTYNGSADKLMTMKSHNVTDRAVIDGIYITNGNADQKSALSGSQTLNIHSYGGAAIVTDYAHVRNCIVRSNQGVYGGALALTHNALVSGCLIEENTADYGGAIYVFEEGKILSDGTEIKSQNGNYKEISTDFDHRYDLNMSHVFSSTIVNNKANVQGGGVWFGTSVPNVRFNSSVVWQNDCQDQANVSGLFQITRPDGATYTTTEYYPFNYCGVQNIQVSGLNNVLLNTDNNLGVRFRKAGGDINDLAVKDEKAEGFKKFDDFGHYDLTNYSIMVHGGMPVENYQSLQERYKLSEKDFLNKDRLVTLSEAEGGGTRHFIEMGALAFAKKFPNEQLMLRLFVSLPEHIDHQAANYMMELGNTATEGSVEQYYSQEGSSFAYPMMHLQDALDYILRLRGFNKGNAILKDVVDATHANDLPFEIFVSDGTFYPTSDLSGNNDNTVGNSFLIPEGVSIIGGNAPQFATDEEGKEYSEVKHFYGAGFTPNIQNKVEGTDYYTAYNQLPLAEKVVTLGDYTIHQRLTDSITVHRKVIDINANSIIEPWEFTHQTILSGFLEGVQNNGVNHVLTVLANEYACGALPTTVGGEHSHEDDASSNADHEYFCAEHGQNIALDGLTVIGGYAHGYTENTVNDRHKLKYNQGGALLVDGNYYYDYYNKVHKGKSTDEQFQKAVYFHATAPGAVGYRDIPVLISNCKFENNHAGYGGAVATNTTLDIFNSSFEHNRALSGRDTVDWTHYDDNKNTVIVKHPVHYPGNGGAIYATHQVSAFNTMFANNEALDTKFDYNPQDYYLLHVLAETNTPPPTTTTTPRKMIGGTGGAVFVARHGYFHFTNCNFVRNQANVYPAVFSYNPNYQAQENTAQFWMQYNQIVNCVLWGNEMNPKMVEAVNNSGMSQKEKEHYIRSASKVVNYGRKDRDATKLYEPAITMTTTAESQEELDQEAQEQIWFSAYEQGKAITANNAYDFRQMEYDAYKHIMTQIREYAAVYTQEDGTRGVPYQNCNIEIASENTVNEGPNFVNPSSYAGYDGYMESADWSPARLNTLSDNGWGKIMQKIVTEGNEYKAEFQTITLANGEKQYDVTGFYPIHRYLKGFIKFQKTIPLGEARYMFADYPEAEMPLHRISYDPNPSHDQTYIDIGVYEYPHTELKYDTEGEQVDVLWVSAREKPDNGLPDGSDWSQPTSDLQRAIETLLASRNGHRKEIRLMDGTFTPVYTINDHLCFYVNTEYLNKSVMMETDDNKLPIYNEGVMSLTIKGGYSHELNNVRDVEAYPAIIRQQRRTDNTSNRWDHLIYVQDPTQRYGKQSYETTSGATEHDFGHYKDQNNKVINTIPLEIDGVTLINDQASSDAMGAAIYYANLDEMTDGTNKDTDGIIEPTPTNVTTSITGEGALTYEYASMKKPAKLVLSKTKVIGSGAYDKNKNVSAVYLGSNGGYSLIYNTVMHSNYGNPLVAQCEARTVNNTFALNNGFVDLGSPKAANSFIHNTVLWKNNLGSTGYDKQFDLAGFGTSATPTTDTSFDWNAKRTDTELPNVLLFSHNAYTGGDTVNTDYKEGATIALRNYNVGLTFDNSDFMLGPHFAEPEHQTLTLRDFSLQPSLRLMHKGDDNLYDDTLDKVEKEENEKTTYELTSKMYDLAMHTSIKEDAASKARKVSLIDIGAYEYQNVLNRVMYVDPNDPSSYTGLGWENAFGQRNLQNAIDLAALYHYNHPTEQAYVFVKGATQGNKDLHTGETLTVRDGVSVYGGIHSMFTAECRYSEDEATKERTYAETDLANYLSAVVSNNEGFIGPNTNRTAVYGINTSKYTLFDTTLGNGITSLVDGFHVTGNNNFTEPAIDIDPQVVEGADAGATKVALRNIVTYDNTSATGADLAKVKNALIYESLFRNNDTDGSVLKLEENAWAVNITAEGKVTGTDGTTWLNGGKTREEEVASHIVNSIANFRGEDTRPEVDAAATRNTLTGHNYVRNDRNCYYQLTEKSKHINEIAIAAGEEGNEFLPANLRPFVNYRTDRDLLGNPRLLTLTGATDNIARLDRGAFETWKIEQDMIYTREEGHYNPHTGSVVYIMEGKSLVCGLELYPGYLLLKEGGNLYGNGQNVKLSFVAVERTVQPGGSVVSVPYNMDYGINAELPTYETNGVLNLTQTGSSTFTYDGAQRSAWDHEFHYQDSENWMAQPENTITPKSQGVLFVPGGTEPTVYRFTAKGAKFDDFIYEEKTDENFKEVVLTKYDDRTSTNDGADFTSKEDMSWNCIGLPYLVSNYETHLTNYSGNAGIYNMHLPHTLWLYYDGLTTTDGSTKVNGHGGYFSVNSWDAATWNLAAGEKAHIWVGEGIFTQTAAVSDEETLTFYRPLIKTPREAPATRSNTRYYVDNTLEEDAELDVLITTSGRSIHISGLLGGERVAIYNMAGQRIAGGTASEFEWHTTVNAAGIYVVTVDENRVKVSLK